MQAGSGWELWSGLLVRLLRVRLLLGEFRILLEVMGCWREVTGDAASWSVVSDVNDPDGGATAFPAGTSTSVLASSDSDAVSSLSTQRDGCSVGGESRKGEALEAWRRV